MPENLPGIIIALPFLAAAVIRLPGIHNSRIVVDCISIATAAITAVLAGMLYCYGAETPVIHWVGGWTPRENTIIGIALVADGISAGFIFLTAALTTSALLFVFRRYETMDSLLQILTLIFLGSFSGFVLAGDLITMFVFLELMGISSYVLTAFKFQDEAPVQAAFNIAIVATTGAFLFLMGVTMIYGLTGTPNIAEAAIRLTEIPATPALVTALTLLLTGLAIKSSLFPFHFAHADSHTVAPAPHAGLFGAILMQAGLYAIVRLAIILFDTPAISPAIFQKLLIAAGITTALTGAVMSIVQNNLKRLLAFSGIAHIGIAAVGTGLLNTAALAGAGLYIAGHAAVKMSLFLAAGVLLHRNSSVHTGKIAGSGLKTPILSAILLTGALALAGMPPSGLYGGKVLIEAGLKEAGIGWMIYPVYLSAALTGAAVIRFTIRYFRPATEQEKSDPVFVREGSPETVKQGGVRYMTAIPAVLLAAGLIITLLPQLTTGIEKAAANSFDRNLYIESVFGNETEASGEIPARNYWNIHNVAKGIISAFFAAAAGVIISIRRYDLSLTTRGPLEFIRNLHSGHVGDYLTWLLLGTALTAAWLYWQLLPFKF